MSISTEQVHEITSEVWSSILGEEAKPATGESRLDGEQLTAAVRIEGAWSGVVSLHCPKQLGLHIAATMFELDQDSVSEDELRDAVGEIANLVGGKIKNILPGPTTLGTPEFVAVAPEGTAVHDLGYRASGNEFRVRVVTC